MSDLPRFDPADLDGVDDPYPVYRRYREAGDGIHWGTSRRERLPEQWWLFRHEDVERALKERGFE